MENLKFKQGDLVRIKGQENRGPFKICGYYPVYTVHNYISYILDMGTEKINKEYPFSHILVYEHLLVRENQWQ